MGRWSLPPDGLTGSIIELGSDGGEHVRAVQAELYSPFPGWSAGQILVLIVAVLLRRPRPALAVNPSYRRTWLLFASLVLISDVDLRRQTIPNRHLYPCGSCHSRSWSLPAWHTAP